MVVVDYLYLDISLKGYVMKKEDDVQVQWFFIVICFILVINNFHAVFFSQRNAILRKHLPQYSCILLQLSICMRLAPTKR